MRLVWIARSCAFYCWTFAFYLLLNLIAFSATEVAAATATVEQAIKDSISLDFSITNRDEEYFINIISEDGYKICDGKISRTGMDQISCIYDDDLLRQGDNTIFITLYSTKRNNIVLQTTSHFYYNRQGKLMKQLSSLTQNRNTLLAAAAIATTGAATGAAYLKQQQHATAPSSKLQARVAAVHKPTAATTAVAAVKPVSKPAVATALARPGASTSTQRSTQSLSSVATASSKATTAATAAITHSPSAPKKKWLSSWRTNRRIKPSNSFNLQQQWSSFVRDSKRVVTSQTARNLGLAAGAIILADGTVRLSKAVATSSSSRVHTKRRKLVVPLPIVKPFAAAVVKHEKKPHSGGLEKWVREHVLSNKDGVARKIAASMFILLTQAAFVALKSTGAMNGEAATRAANQAINRFVPFKV